MKNNHSFTLIELLVSLGIISVVVLIVTGTYVFIIGSREKTLGQTDLHQEGQYIMSLMAKDIRSSKIDYSAIGTIPKDSPITYLILQNIEETECSRYRRITSDNRGIIQKCVKTKTEPTKNCADTANVCQDTDFQDLTNKDINIKNLNFYIQPNEDPFNKSSSSEAKKQQPRCTITFNLKSLKEKVGENKILFQQTIFERWTKRD